MQLLRDKKGSAVLMAALALASLTLIITGIEMQQYSSRAVKQQLNYAAQADNVSRGGLTAALNWFKRQPQPVQTFFPRSPDTLDESIGLVQEYPLSNTTNLWARFEIRKMPNEPAVNDITALRSSFAAGAGLVWSVESVGTVYRKNSSNPLILYNQAPNQVVATSHARTEFGRLGLSVPSTFQAIDITDSANYTGIPGAGTITLNPPGIGCALPLPGNFIQDATTPRVIFGFSAPTIAGMADVSASNVAGLPATIPDSALVYIDGDATYDATHPLKGSGILFIRGNLTLPANATMFFSGVIYVGGNATILGDGQLTGSFIVAGSLTIDESAGGSFAADYNDAIVDGARQQLVQYRTMKPTVYSLNPAP